MVYWCNNRLEASSLVEPYSIFHSVELQTSVPRQYAVFELKQHTVMGFCRLGGHTTGISHLCISAEDHAESAMQKGKTDAIEQGSVRLYVIEKR